MSEKGILLIISGLSGAGKGTIVDRLLKDHPDEYVLSISATTRKPRPGESEGVQYFYKTREEFETMLENGQLLEHAEYVGNYYGTPRQWVLDRMRENKNVILEIEVQGAFQIKKIVPEAITVFVLPPDMEELKRRLKGRGSETDEEIEKRLMRAEEEIKLKGRYDYVIVNKTIENSVEMLHNIVLANKDKQRGES